MSAVRRPDPRRVASLFEALADLDPEEAERRLKEECAGDQDLYAAVAEVLEHDRAAPPGFLVPGSEQLAEALRRFDPDSTARSSSDAVADDEPLSGSTRLGRYYVLHKLGEGGMGVVYAAYDDVLHRRVAIKVLRRDVAARDWLLREGQALGRLSHPSVVTVYEVGEYEGRVFLVMEFIEGPTLRAWLDESPRPFSDTLRLFLQAGRGLAAAHGAGLIHRDFKPENVILGADGRARVVDFGIVALAQGAPAAPEEASPRADALASSLTQTGALMGTPAYMSPEQFGSARATPLSDQYSFCVALYRAVYAVAPYRHADLAQLIESVLREPAAPPPRRPDVPAWLAPIVLRGLSRDPALRFPSMGELMGAIDRHLPRDPALDYTSVLREKRIFELVFLASVALASAPMVSDAGARVLMSSAGLIAVPAVLLGLVLGMVGGRWPSLSRNQHGRRLAGVFVTSICMLLGHRLIAMRIGLSGPQILVEDEVLLGAIWCAVAQLFEAWLMPISVLVGIAAVVSALLPARVPLIFGLVGFGCMAVMLISVALRWYVNPEALVRWSDDPEEVAGRSPRAEGERR